EPSWLTVDRERAVTSKRRHEERNRKSDEHWMDRMTGDTCRAVGIVRPRLIASASPQAPRRELLQSLLLTSHGGTSLPALRPGKGRPGPASSRTELKCLARAQNFKG